MLRRFIQWVDSWDDHINPLVVRDVRRMFRNTYLWILYSYCIFIILIVIITWNNKLTFACVSLAFAGAICYIGAWWGWFTTLEMSRIFRVDEMFRMNTLSPRQYLHAYITMSIIKSLFITSLSLPPLTVVQLIGVPGLNLHFWYIISILAFLGGQTVNLAFL
ncbi:MAG: hypothetical protein LBC02_13190, partial [Planctomycetaceae bacterium]|nr:hypothetical protein [Planctomycetaceae bacterium]